MVGISGRFTAGDFLLTTIALVAGSWSGALSVLIGTVLAYAFRPPIFFGLDFLPAMVNVTIAALLLSNRHRIAQAIYIAILIAFLSSPYSLLFGYAHVPYAWLHIVALAILLSPIVTKIPAWVADDGPRQMTAIALLAFVGTMAQHLTGGILYEFAVGVIGGIRPSSFQEFWGIIFWLYPLERLAIIGLSTVIAMAIYRSLRRWAV
jgi:hypothetical protein